MSCPTRDTGWVQRGGAHQREVTVSGIRIRLLVYTRARAWGGRWRWEVTVPAAVGMRLGHCGDLLGDLLPSAGLAMMHADGWLRGFASGVLDVLGNGQAAGVQ